MIATTDPNFTGNPSTNQPNRARGQRHCAPTPRRAPDKSQACRHPQIYAAAGRRACRERRNGQASRSSPGAESEAKLVCCCMFGRSMRPNHRHDSWSRGCALRPAARRRAEAPAVSPAEAGSAISLLHRGQHRARSIRPAPDGSVQPVKSSCARVLPASSTSAFFCS